MRLPLHLALEDIDGRPVEATMGSEGGLIVRRGVVRFDLTPAATLTLLRRLLWWGLRGRWAGTAPRR